MARLPIDGYGQLELNNVAFRRDGRVEAQLPLDSTDFASIPAENGMLLEVDRVGKTIKLPSATSNLVALHYSAEHMYEEGKTGLKNFKLELGEFLPRLGYLAVGDKFTSNCIDWTGTEETLVTALGTLATTPLYGGISEATGAILVSDTEPATGPVLLVLGKATMPDGQLAIKFQVVEA